MSPLDGNPAAFEPTTITRSLYDRAADEIERRGHTKNKLCDQRGAVCLYGAIHVADHGDPYHRGRSWDEWTRRLGFEYWGDAVNWNNDPDRTQAEVVARLRAAARAERGES